MGIELDKDMAATLTEEELAAINDSEISEEELASMKGIAEGAGEDDEDEDDSDGDLPVEKLAAKEAAKTAVADDENTESNNDDADAEAFKPKYQAQLPQDFAAQIDSIKTETRTLAQQFKEGDIDLDEYNIKVEALNEKRDGLMQQKLKADIFSEMDHQTAEQQWQWTINQFTSKTAKSEGIDYRKDQEKAADLDIFVKRLAESPANSDKPMDWFLVEAHKRVMALHCIAQTDASAPKDKLKEAKESRKPPLGNAPKTLAQVPGGDGPGDMGNEFNDLDGLDGIDLESAIAKMTPAQRERFAKAM
jgi:hypothetical protein